MRGLPKPQLYQRSPRLRRDRPKLQTELSVRLHNPGVTEDSPPVTPVFTTQLPDSEFDARRGKNPDHDVTRRSGKASSAGGVSHGKAVNFYRYKYSNLRVSWIQLDLAILADVGYWVLECIRNQPLHAILFELSDNSTGVDSTYVKFNLMVIRFDGFHGG